MKGASRFERGFGIDLTGRGAILGICGLAVDEEEDGAVGLSAEEVEESALGVGGTDVGELLLEAEVGGVDQICFFAGEGLEVVKAEGLGNEAGLLEEIGAESGVGAIDGPPGEHGGGQEDDGDKRSGS